MNLERLRVSYVPDGDTLRAFTARGEEVRIRLAHVDAPEMSQAPYGLAARAYFRRLLNLQELIELRRIGTDMHGRSVGEVIRLRDGANCGLRLVQQGYIALYRCPRDRGEYYAAQDEARRLGRGIWKVPGLQQTPWLYRQDE